MPHVLKRLPYEPDAFEPYFSRDAITLHHDWHERACVEKLNHLIAGTDLEKLPLSELVRIMGPSPDSDSPVPHNTTRRAIRENAAQAWNHEFYWNCLTPEVCNPADRTLAGRITRDFGSFEGFKQKFDSMALNFVGAGWVWLYARADGSLGICVTGNADTLCAGDTTPLLVCDIWEHAYSIDRRNDREGYLSAFWCLVNWEFVARNLAQADFRHGMTPMAQPYLLSPASIPLPQRNPTAALLQPLRH